MFGNYVSTCARFKRKELLVWEKRVLRVLSSHHLGWVKMEPRVVMAVLILSWAKLFQQESTALRHCWRGCLSAIFPFVSHRSNPILYFRFYLPVSSHPGSKIHLCALSLLYAELTSLSPLSPSFLTLYTSVSLFFSPIGLITSWQISLCFSFSRKGFQDSCLWCFCSHLGYDLALTCISDFTTEASSWWA